MRNLHHISSSTPSHTEPTSGDTLEFGPYATDDWAVIPKIRLSYQAYGQPIGKAPVILVVHGLTGNSNLAGPGGWWTGTVGPGLALDTNQFTILAFDTPPNGYAVENPCVVYNYKALHAGDIAAWFGEGLQQLGITKLHAAIGLSLGAGIVWEMATLFPKLIDHLVPVAGDWKSTDWVIAASKAQEDVLLHSDRSVEDARKIAMLLYRHPSSISGRFARQVDSETGEFVVERWLSHHGNSFAARFSRHAYLVLNHFMSRIDITRNHEGFREATAAIQAEFHLVGIESDLLFVPNEIRETEQKLTQNGHKATYYEIESNFGHDAFLLEEEQIGQVLKSIVQIETPVVL